METTAGGARLLLIYVGAGVAAGLLSGLLGVGGGIVLVPLLVLVLKWEQKPAQATALVLVSMAALAGVIGYAAAGQVAVLPAVFILAGGLVGAWVGAIVVQRVHPHWLQVAFGVVMFAAAVRLAWPVAPGAVSIDSSPALTPSLALAFVVSGLAMGLLSALFGIGGGIVLIPILVTLLDFDQKLAAGTSLAVMIPIALLGALRLSRVGLTQWSAGWRIGLGGIVGGLVGAQLALRLPTDVLAWIFGALLVFVGARMIWTGVRTGRELRESPV
ncbi:MAG: sulfite exporter TauE/SafE family protein [Actinomycetota bacterium]